MRYCIFGSRPMASFPGYTIVSNNGFQIDYNITITLTLDFWQQVDWLYTYIHYIHTLDFKCIVQEHFSHFTDLGRR